MKFLQVSDTHLGYYQYGLPEREADFYDVFEEAIDIAIENNVDFILHSGDFFHTSRPSNDVFLKSIKLIQRLKEKNIPIFTISGNHDRGNQVRDISPLKILESFGLNLIQQESLEHNGIVISGLKYISKVAIRKTGLKPILELLLEKSPSKNALHLLMLHHEFQPFFPYSGLNIHEEIPEGFDYIGIGHYHIPQKPFKLKDSFVLYSGSTEFTAYNEKEENYPKGVHLIQYENKDFKYQFIELKRKRPFVKFEIDEENLSENLKELNRIVEKSLEENEKKPVLILRGMLKKLSPKEISILLEKEKIINKLLYVNYGFSKIIEDNFTEVYLGENENLDDKLKELIDDEFLQNKVIDIVSTLKTFESIDEVKKYIKENPSILDI
jgi:DNA repair exonuclease SbcCD nuclease subunit